MRVLMMNKFPSMSCFDGMAKLATAATSGLPDSVISGAGPVCVADASSLG